MRTRTTRKRPSDVFAALGDDTRLGLVDRLAREGPLSITRLTEGAAVTRQAITKHLRLLERNGLVCSATQGRETLWTLRREPIAEAQRHLDAISAQWDQAIERLRRFVED